MLWDSNNVLTNNGKQMNEQQKVFHYCLKTLMCPMFLCTLIYNLAGMESPSGPRIGKLSSSGLPRGRIKHGHPQEFARTTPVPDNNNKHSE